MRKVLGVDGAGSMWLAAIDVGNGSPDVSLYDSFDALWDDHDDADVVLVDIPIGLRDDGEPRTCDTEARRRVRRGVVFPAPSRPAAEAHDESYDEAKRVNETVTGGTGLSVQTYNILPLIHEVDSFLREHPGAHGVVREAHPEVCLWALDGGETVPSKKQTDEGYEERLRILEGYEEGVRDAVRDAVSRYSDQAAVTRDDVVDALALLVTARGPTDTLPEDPPTDGHGLPMEMVYRTDALG